MSCKLTYNFIEYLEGKMTADKSFQLEQHLVVCPSCVQKLEIVRKSIEAINFQKEVLVNPFLFTRIEQKMQKKEHAHEIFMKRILQPALITFIVLLAVGGGYFIGNSYNTTSTVSTSDLYSQYVQPETIEITLLSEE